MLKKGMDHGEAIRIVHQVITKDLVKVLEEKKKTQKSVHQKFY